MKQRTKQNSNREYVNMKALPASEQPYEKCLEQGPEYLSDAELLAVIIRTGSLGERSIDLARNLLFLLPGKRLEGLFEMSLEQLQEIRGIGKVKAIQLQCLAECCRRMGSQKCHREEKLICGHPGSVAAYFMNRMRCLEIEQVLLLVLDGKNAMKKAIVISKGSFTASYAAPREIYYYALKHKAVSIILLHNHPSGDPTPSRDDIALTKRLAATGNMIGIPLLDHIVIGEDRYISLKEEGYLR